MNKLPQITVRALCYGGRAAVCLALLYFGYVAVQAITTLLGPRPEVEFARADSGTESLPNPLQLVPSDGDGYWTFAGWGWEVRLSNAEQQAKEPDIPRYARARPRTIHQDEARFVEMLVRLGAARRTCGRTSTYQLQLQGSRVLVVTQSDGTDSWLAYAALKTIAGNNEGLQKLELRRSGRTDDQGCRPELIPMPAPVRRVAARITERGSVQMELLQRCPPIERLKPILEETGYSVRMLDGAEHVKDKWLICIDGDAYVLWNLTGEQLGGTTVVNRVTTSDIRGQGYDRSAGLR